MANINNLASRFDKVLSLPEKIGKGADIMTATSLLHQRAHDILYSDIKWKSYLNGLIINQDEYEFLTKFESINQAGRPEFFGNAQNRQELAMHFQNLLERISTEQIVHYLLVLIDEILMEDKTRVDVFKEFAAKRKDSVWTPFFKLLNKDDPFTQNMTARIIAKIACWSEDLMEGSDLNYFLCWLRDNLNLKDNDYLQNIARCLQMMLRIEEYRTTFVAIDGIKNIVNVLSNKTNFQIQYQLIFCLWIITFNANLIEKLSKYNIIPILADILAETVKEKVTRIILATFRNLSEKPEDKEIVRDNAITMVQCKVPKQLEILQQSSSKFDDEDVISDIEELSNRLHSYVLDLSSFDEYSNEVKSGRLEWSPVHSSEKFWRENAHRLNEKNHELLKILVKLLETSKDNLVLSVAAHDIGEYVRHYPRGKTSVENLGGKKLVMELLTHQEPHVKYEALLCLQKLMVQNFDYLSKKLENETGLKDERKQQSLLA